MKPYKIDKGIKLPPVSVSNGANEMSRAVVTMLELKKGESFLVTDASESLRAEKRMRDFMLRERRRGGGKEFASRRLKTGVRIWRTK